MTATTFILRGGIAAACLALTGCAPEPDTDIVESNVVNIYNWADYIAPDTISKFEAEYGIKVNYDVYDASAVVDVKLLTGNSGFDVIVHSNWRASSLAPIGVYEKLDTSLLPNIVHLDPDMMEHLNVYKIVEGYMVPYHWGTTGYAWNADMVYERLPDHPMTTGDVLFNPEVISILADCGVSLLDSPSDMLSAAFAYLGGEPEQYDVSDENLAAAEAQLKKIRPYVRYFSNEKMLSELPNKEVCVAMSWSGDFAQAQLRAKEAGIDIDLRYTVPEEGSRLWVDGLYILADAPHRENAYRFINFLLRPDIAAANASYSFYANANRSSWEFMNPEVLNNPAIFPDASTWERIYALPVSDVKRVRPRTRAFARVKSGLD
jgi:putrescine transport system substrate-binding protein